MRRGTSLRLTLGVRELEQVRQDLTGRDLAIIGQVSELRLLSAVQIKAVHFSASEHESDAAAGRACQRTLSRLAQARLLVRLERRVGGVRAGSASYVYAIGPVGERVLGLQRPRRRTYEPTLRFVRHTLAIAQLVVDVTLAARLGDGDVLMCQSEPRCYREFSGTSGRTVLKPDLFLALGVGDYEHRWFIEVDLDTESLPVLVRKCRWYEGYYRSGKEEAEHGVFPKVCWIVPTERRAARLRNELARDRRLTHELFQVVTPDQALGVLSGGAS